MISDLIFFDQNGNPYNFIWNESLERWEGTIHFLNGSTDTNQIKPIYVLERTERKRISTESLYLERFQLFNETQFRIGPGSSDFSVTKVEAINNEKNFYTKKVHATGIGEVLKVGDRVAFSDDVLDIGSLANNYHYTVIGANADWINIVTQTNNLNYNTTWTSEINDPNYWADITVKAISYFSVSDYLAPKSSWNESTFYNNLDAGRNLVLTNGGQDDEDYEISIIKSLNDSYRTVYEITTSDWLNNQDFNVKIGVKAQSIELYTGNMTLTTGDKKIQLAEDLDEGLVRSGSTIIVSNLSYATISHTSYTTTMSVTSNTIDGSGNVLTVAQVTPWDGHQTQFYDLGTQREWRGVIYQSQEAYWHKPGDGNPGTRPDIWKGPDYLIVEEDIDSKSFSGDIFLNQNWFDFQQSWNISNLNTFYQFYNRWNDEISNLNIGVSIEDDTIKFIPEYSDNWSELKFFAGTFSLAVPSRVINDKVVQINETPNRFSTKLKAETNVVKLIITDIDDGGLKIICNGYTCDVDSQLTYILDAIDVRTSINDTLTEWLSLWETNLNNRGIQVVLSDNDETSPDQANKITFTSDYPNLKLDLQVIVESGSAYYFERYSSTFNTSLLPSNPDDITVTINDTILATENLQSLALADLMDLWIAEWNDYIFDVWGLIVVRESYVLKWGSETLSNDFTIVVVAGGENGEIPAIETIDETSGQYDIVLSSNRIIEPNNTLVTGGMYNGASFTINNSVYIGNNNKYRVIDLDANQATLSYEGPFWSENDLSTNAISATDIDYFDFVANWEANSGANGYYLDVSTQIDFSSYVSGYQNKDVGNNVSHLVEGLSSNTTYYYRVRVYNSEITGDNSNSVATETLSFILDDQSTPAGAFSFNILRGEYYQSSGALVTLRRSSDDAEETFYPTREDGYELTMNSVTSGDVTLDTWVGSDNAFVKTWYGQGDTNNFEETTNSLQPQLISSGSFITDGGKPAIDFDGSQGLVTTNGYIMELSQNDCSLYIVRSVDNTLNGEYLLTEGDATSPYSSNVIVGGASGSGIVAWVNTDTFGTLTTGRVLMGFEWDSTNFQAYTNGSTNGSSGTPTVNSEVYNLTSLGIRPDKTTSFFTGKVQMVLSFKEDNSANRSTLASRINSYYSIY